MWGAIKKPWYMSLRYPQVAPSPLPAPGTLRREPAPSIRSFLPTKKAPALTIPAPAFLNRDPAIISAP